ncbi:MAG: DNA-3-methyladenine glycosylase [Candidatus Moranbacteria bacterium]|jgi:DNA-3-methyladenine glycosylase|nr:DNA-3-methyladenine glycosylase [Candidatus Moranbacteria bacterium]
MILKKEFYARSAMVVARDLLGCFLVRKIDGKILKSMIVETEAYEGMDDLASHASHGRTPRNDVMFGEPGICYVYLTYGMHHMLNIVTGKKDYPAAVLIRAVEPFFEIENPSSFETSARQRKTNGPAKLTKVLQIDRIFNKAPVYVKKYGLWIEEGERIKKSEIVCAKRIGIDYAGKYKDKPWRFYIKDNKFVSKKDNFFCCMFFGGKI